MGRLTDSVRENAERSAKAARNAPVPDWMPRLAIGAGAVLAVVVLIGLFTADDPAPIASPGRQGVAGETVPTTAGNDSTTTTEGDAVQGGDTVQVTNVDGATVDVPAAAVEVAHDVAIATLTGDTTGIPVAGEPPSFAATAPVGAPVVAATTISNDPDQDPLVFTVAVAPARGAETVSRTIEVMRTAEGWAWRPLSGR